MLRLAAAAAATVAIAAPALAADFVLTIRNDSSQAVTRLNTFAVDADGKPIEDNLGAISTDIAAHSTGTLKLDIARCQPVWLAVVLDETDDLATTIDMCASRTLVVSD